MLFRSREGAIAYEAVTAPDPSGPGRLSVAGLVPAPIEIRWVPPSATATAQDAILDDLTVAITNLLSATIAAAADAADASRPVKPSDIAVLVKSHADGNLVARVLRDAGIPAVRAGVGSVEHSEAAEQLRALLHALARPSDTRRVRLIATGWFFGIEPAALSDERILVRAQVRIAVQIGRAHV